MTSSCTSIQEQMVAGETLAEAEQGHVLVCPSCSQFAADCLALDAMVAEGVDAAVSVPDDFADRVMNQLPAGEAPHAWERLLGRRWVELVLANVGIAFAVVNLVRFVFSALLPTAGLGGVP